MIKQIAVVSALLLQASPEPSPSQSTFNFFGKSFCVIERARYLSMEETASSGRWTNAPTSIEIEVTSQDWGATLVIKQPGAETLETLVTPSTFALSFHGLSAWSHADLDLTRGRLQYASRGKSKDGDDLWFVYDAQCFKP